MKFKWTLAAALLVTTAWALTVKQASIKKLTEDAALIVIGKVESQTAQWENGNIFTHVTLEVKQCLKGKLPNKFVVVKNYGGTIGETSQIVSGAPEFAPGKEVMLFLVAWRDEYYIHSIALGEFTLIQENNRRYAINDLSHVTLVDPVTHQKISEPEKKRTKVELEAFIQQVRDFVRE